MPKIHVAPEHAARPFHAAEDRWAVRCPSCSPQGADTFGLGLENVSLSREVAQGVADLHNRVVHGIE